MSVPVQATPTLVVGKAAVLFAGVDTRLISRTHDVSPDGSRFLMFRDLASASPTQFVVLQHWFSRLTTSPATP